MRATRVARGGLGLAAAIAAGASLVACFDLFHSTAGLRDACDLDAAACADDAVAPDAAPAGTDFCTWSPGQARDNATHACAWLGACESPLGHDAFGPCMVDALLAYDCTANPNHPSRGKGHAFWDCLWQVASCADVTACVFPGGAPTCGDSGTYTQCGNSGGVAANADVRIECSSGGLAVGENCAMHGQTCALDPVAGAAVCAGANADAGGVSCSGPLSCASGEIHVCSGGTDVGIDCRSSGGNCGGFPTGNPTWLACVASSAGSDAGCTPTLSATCSGGYATSCPSGVPESIDCQEILQQPGSCQPGNLANGFDWTSPCQVNPPACTVDTCDDAGALTGCARGAPFTVSCAAQQLGPCSLAQGVGGTFATCAPPTVDAGTTDASAGDGAAD